jgi:transcriptional regulator with XRE-family HTH domain
MLRAEELKARRAVEKLSQDELASMLGITRTYLSEIENGRKKVSKALEERYDRIYPKRLIDITWSRGVECPRCHTTTPPKKLSEPKDKLDTVYYCPKCGYYFPLGEAWGYRYRP